MDREQIEKRSFLGRLYSLEQEKNQLHTEKQNWIKEKQCVYDQLYSYQKQQSDWAIEKRALIGRIHMLEHVIYSMTDELVAQEEQNEKNELEHGTKIRFRYKGVVIDGIVREIKQIVTDDTEKYILHLHEGDWENSSYRHASDPINHLGELVPGDKIACRIHGEEKQCTVKEIKQRSDKIWLRQVCLYVE
jgi:hypothetical protein